MRTQLGAGPGTTVLLDVAMFRPEKNQAGLIRAVAGLPPECDWQLWLAGEGSERAACERLARRLGQQERVRFTGFCGDPGPLYRAADIAVHASREESLCNFVIEAQAHGLPAVVFEALGMAECLVPGRTGWILPQGDVAGFRETLLRLMEEARGGPAQALERERRAAEAAAFARAGFDPRQQVGTYLALFHRVTSRHP